MKQASQSDFNQQLASLREEYVQHLPTELASLELLANALPNSESAQTDLQQLHGHLHKISGASGTFGLPELGTQARTLELRIQNWLETASGKRDPSAYQLLASNIAELSNYIKPIQPAQTPLQVNAPAPASNSEHVIKLLLISSDIKLSSDLSQQLESFGYQVEVCPTIKQSLILLQNGQPDLLLLDAELEQAENVTNLQTLMGPLQTTQCPVLLISEQDNFHSRMQASKLGVDGYFLKPLNIPQLISQTAQLLEKQQAPPQKVLIVDDDINLAAYYQQTLIAAGIHAEVLNKPELIINKLTSLRPELVLLDLHMPEYSGPELAGLIRQYEHWTSLPLVYLSGETDLNQQIHAMDRGADDFLSKPISEIQLVAAVRVRIERARQLAQQITRDSLTGLLKHASIKEAADVETIRSRRSKNPVIVVMLDIDHFKAVNDNYGYATGDSVISALATMLRQRMRQSDFVGRYGGEEFVIVLPECDTMNAIHIINDLREHFSKLNFSSADNQFNCTFSAGLACSTDFPDSTGSQLLLIADETMYTAKRSGRNCVKTPTIKSAKE